MIAIARIPSSGSSQPPSPYGRRSPCRRQRMHLAADRAAARRAVSSPAAVSAMKTGLHAPSFETRIIEKYGASPRQLRQAAQRVRFRASHARRRSRSRAARVGRAAPSGAQMPADLEDRRGVRIGEAALERRIGERRGQHRQHVVAADERPAARGGAGGERGDARHDRRRKAVGERACRYMNEP